MIYVSTCRFKNGTCLVTYRYKLCTLWHSATDVILHSAVTGEEIQGIHLHVAPEFWKVKNHPRCVYYMDYHHKIKKKRTSSYKHRPILSQFNVWYISVSYNSNHSLNQLTHCIKLKRKPRRNTWNWPWVNYKTDTRPKCPKIDFKHLK